jgi:hypothetical protein
VASPAVVDCVLAALRDHRSLASGLADLRESGSHTFSRTRERVSDDDR